MVKYCTLCFWVVHDPHTDKKWILVVVQIRMPYFCRPGHMKSESDEKAGLFHDQEDKIRAVPAYQFSCITLKSDVYVAKIKPEDDTLRGACGTEA